jgi:mannose-6-phosphate isomerase-like protein (cupin superfamily)
MLQRAGIAEVEVLAAIMARCFRSNYTGLISEAAFEADLAIAALTERVRSYVQRKVSETWAIRDGEGFVSFGASTPGSSAASTSLERTALGDTRGPDTPDAP